MDHFARCNRTRYADRSGGMITRVTGDWRTTVSDAPESERQVWQLVTRLQCEDTGMIYVLLVLFSY